MPLHPASRRNLLLGAAAATLLATSRSARSREPGRLIIGGTGMALATMRQIAAEFTTSNPTLAVDILPSLGTGGGLSAVAAGAIDLALAARPLSDAERAKGLQSQAYARTPIAFVTPPATAADGVTMADVMQIFTGGMMAWPDGAPIRLIRREPSDADWSMFRAMSPEMAQAVEVALQRPGLLTVATDQENADALERLHGSFGAMSIAQLRAEERRLKPLVLDGTAPGVDAIASARYPLARTLHIVWRPPARPEIAQLLAYLGSAPAGALLARLGQIPLAGTGA